MRWNFLGGLGIAGVVLSIVLWIAVVWGWLLNIVDLFHMNAILTGEGILRIIGIFVAPLGAIMGWFV